MKPRIEIVTLLAALGAGLATAQPIGKFHKPPPPPLPPAGTTTIAPPVVNIDKSKVVPANQSAKNMALVPVTVKAAPVPTLAIAPLASTIPPAKIKRAVGKGTDPRIRAPNLSATPESSGQPTVAATGDDAYVAWTEGAGRGAILLSQSRDGGASFWPAINLSGTTGRAHHPRIAANAQGVHVVWVEDTAAGPRAYYSVARDRGDTFSPPRELAAMTLTDSQIAIGLDGADAFVVIAATSGATPVVELVQPSTNATTELLRGSTARRPVIALGGKEIAVAWEYNPYGTDWDVIVESSSDRGRTFYKNTYLQRDKEATIRSNSGDQGPIGLATTGAGHYMLAYETKNPEKRVNYIDAIVATSGVDLVDQRGELAAVNALAGVYTYPANDKTFDFDRSVDLTAASGVMHGITATAIEVNGRIEGNVVVFHSGSSTATGLGGLGRTPKLAASPAGYLGTWVEGDATAGEVVAARKTGDNTYTSFALSANAGNSFAPAVAAGASNYIVVWTDTTPGNADIFFRAIPVR